MRTAYSIWQGRIAPVFDVSSTILVRETDNGKLLSEKTVTLPAGSVYHKGLVLAENMVAALVCGAVSRDAAAVLVSFSIKIVPFVSGQLEEVIAAFEQDRLQENRFMMPGCGRRRRCRGAVTDFAKTPECRRRNNFYQGG